jgi:hypothetical protein
MVAIAADGLDAAAGLSAMIPAARRSVPARPVGDARDQPESRCWDAEGGSEQVEQRAVGDLKAEIGQEASGPIPRPPWVS